MRAAFYEDHDADERGEVLRASPQTSTRAIRAHARGVITGILDETIAAINIGDSPDVPMVWGVTIELNVQFPSRRRWA